MRFTETGDYQQQEMQMEKLTNLRQMVVHPYHHPLLIHKHKFQQHLFHLHLLVQVDHLHVLLHHLHLLVPLHHLLHLLVPLHHQLHLAPLHHHLQQLKQNQSSSLFHSIGDHFLGHKPIKKLFGPLCQ